MQDFNHPGLSKLLCISSHDFNSGHPALKEEGGEIFVVFILIWNTKQV